MEFIAYAETIREWLSETYKEKELTIREDLEAKVNEIFEKMYHGHRRVAIDSKYHVELLTTIADKEIAAGESGDQSGQKLCLYCRLSRTR